MLRRDPLHKRGSLVTTGEFIVQLDDGVSRNPRKCNDALVNGVDPRQEETAPMLDDLYSLWFAHLWDNIPSVREDTAIALGNVVRSYGQEALDRVLPKVVTGTVLQQ
jgi:hypothetical protein